MKLRIKPLTKPEQSVEVNLFEAVHSAFGVDPAGQRLVFKGCPLLGTLFSHSFPTVNLDKSRLISQYGIRDGDKLTLVIKQVSVPDSFQERRPSFETLLRNHLAHTYSEREVEVIVSKFMHILFTRINAMSLNDIERLAEIWKQSD
ncbi:ubiquitin, partial [Clonorchis sinensis]